MIILNRSASFDAEQKITVNLNIIGSDSILATHSSISALQFDQSGNIVIDITATLDTHSNLSHNRQKEI